MKTYFLVPLFCLAALCGWAQESAPPVRLAIVGLTHDHVRGFLPDLLARKEVQLAGIVETDRDLIAQIAAKFNLEPAMFFPSLEALRAKTNVQAVATFTSTFDHRRVVEMCAPLASPS